MENTIENECLSEGVIGYSATDSDSETSSNNTSYLRNKTSKTSTTSTTTTAARDIHSRRRTEKSYRVQKAKIGLFVDWLYDAQVVEGLHNYVFNSAVINHLRSCLRSTSFAASGNRSANKTGEKNDNNDVDDEHRETEAARSLFSRVLLPRQSKQNGQNEKVDTVNVVHRSNGEVIIWLCRSTPDDIRVDSAMKLNGLLTRYVACLASPIEMVDLPDFSAQTVAATPVKLLPLRDLILFGWDAFRGPMNQQTLPYAYNALESIPSRNAVKELSTWSRAYEEYKRTVYSLLIDVTNENPKFSEQRLQIESLGALLCARTIHALGNMQELSERHRQIFNDDFLESIAKYYPRIFTKRPSLSEDAARGVLRYLDRIVSSLQRKSRKSNKRKVNHEAKRAAKRTRDVGKGERVNRRKSERRNVNGHNKETQTTS